jgi:hypothetical protein
VIRYCLLDLHELCHCSESLKRLRKDDIGFAWRTTTKKVLPRCWHFAAMMANAGSSECIAARSQHELNADTRSLAAKFETQREMIRCGD